MGPFFGLWHATFEVCRICTSVPLFPTMYVDENCYTSTFGGLQGLTSTPTVMMTRNINKQKPIKKHAGVTKEEKERRCNHWEVQGKCTTITFVLWLQRWCWEYHTLSMWHWEYDTLSVTLTAATKNTIGNCQYCRFMTFVISAQWRHWLVCCQRGPSFATLWTYWYWGVDAAVLYHSCILIPLWLLVVGRWLSVVGQLVGLPQ